MHSSARIKPMISTPKEESYRGYRVSPTMTGHYGPGEVYTQQRSLPTYRRSPSNGESSENIHYIQRNVNAPGYYKNKKPGEMSDIYENERIIDLNYSDSTPYAARSYNYYNNPHDDPRSGIPVLSTRAPSNRDEQLSDSTEMNDFTQRETPTTRRVINNTYFMAEKVYSMKIRSQGIMASLVPLGKSKNLNQTAKYSSAKGTAPARSHLDLRDSEEYTAYLESSSLRFGDTSLVEGTSRNRNILQKTLGTNSRKFIGSVNKETSGLQSPTLKRGNSCKKITKSPIRSTPNNQQPQKDKYLNGSQVMSYQLLNSQKKERSLNALQAKLDTFFMKIDTTMWQICQRNKRIVFVLILEKLHQHKLKVTQYLERKTIILKSKSFARWKKMLSEIRQEKEEQLKSHHAMEFYNQKLAKKTLKILRTLDNSELKATPKRSTSIKSNKQNKTPRSPSMSLLKPVLPQNNYITPRNASQPRVATPQSKTKTTLERVKSIEKSTEKKSYRPTTPKKEYSLTPVKSKSSETSTSTSQKKPFVPISSRTSSMTQLAKSESEITETPAFQRNQIRFPTFGKAANYYEPSEIQELTELSQSPQKRPSSPAFQNSGLDQSFGCENLDQTSPTIQGGFDTILAEILQASNAHQEPESALSIIPQPIKKDELVLALPKLDIKQEPAKKYSKRKNLAQKSPIYSTIRSARDYSSPREKDLSRSYSLSARLKQEAKTTKASDKIKFSFSGLNKSCLVTQAKSKDDLESEKIKNERAIRFRNKKLCQKALENLMCGNNNSDSDSQDLQNNSDEKIKKAETHYYNNLKIKILSGLLENYVHAYKDKERCKKHYEENLLKRTFSVWSSSITKTRNDTQNEEDQVSEATYNEIVKRFRYIVLTEKAMYHWKNFHRELKQNKDN